MYGERGRTPPSLGIDSSRRIRRPAKLRSSPSIGATRASVPAVEEYASRPRASNSAQSAAPDSDARMGKVFGLMGLRKTQEWWRVRQPCQWETLGKRRRAAIRVIRLFWLKGEGRKERGRRA